MFQLESKPCGLWLLERKGRRTSAENWASKVWNSELRFRYILASVLSGISVSTLLMIFCLTLGQSVKLSNLYAACDLLKNQYIHLSGCCIKDMTHQKKKSVSSVSHSEIVVAEPRWQIDRDCLTRSLSDIFIFLQLHGASFSVAFGPKSRRYTI